MDYIPNFKRGKHDPESVEYLDERLKPILEPTYGVAAYQEQLMEISKSLGGFTPGEADTLRKAIGKKNATMLATLRDKFMAGCAASGVSTDGAEELWNWMEKAEDTLSTRATARATRSWPSRPPTSKPTIPRLIWRPS